MSYHGTCKCGASWTGVRACHCSGCHATFSGLGLFELHRATGPRGRICLPPDDPRVGATFRDGLWRGPEMDEVTRIRLT